MIESSDGRYLVVTDNGYVKPALVVVDLKNFLVKARLSVENAWLGLAPLWTPAITLSALGVGIIGGVANLALRRTPAHAPVAA